MQERVFALIHLKVFEESRCVTRERKHWRRVPLQRVNPGAVVVTPNEGRNRMLLGIGPRKRALG